MKKEILYIMILFIIGLVSSQSINVDFPESVRAGEEFEMDFELVDFDDDVYDIKIDIRDGSSNIADILVEGEWENSRLYVNDIIDTSDNNEVKLRVKIDEGFWGDYNFVVKIRNSANSIDEFEDYSIKVDEGDVDDSNSEIDIEVDYDEDDLINNEEFRIRVNSYNLLDEEYDLKIWIEDEEGNIISETYNKEEDDWRAGNYYIDNIFKGPGDDSANIELRLKNDYEDFVGDAILHVKLRDVDEIEEDIEILDNKNVKVSKTNSNSNPDIYPEYQKYIEEQAKKIEEERAKENQITGNAIVLGVERESGDNSELVYESNQSIILKYSLFGFMILLIIFCILLIWNKLK